MTININEDVKIQTPVKKQGQKLIIKKGEKQNKNQFNNLVSSALNKKRSEAHTKLEKELNFSRYQGKKLSYTGKVAEDVERGTLVADTLKRRRIKDNRINESYRIENQKDDFMIPTMEVHKPGELGLPFLLTLVAAFFLIIYAYFFNYKSTTENSHDNIEKIMHGTRYSYRPKH